MNKVNTSNKFKGKKCINCGSTKHIFNDCTKQFKKADSSENFDDGITRTFNNQKHIICCQGCFELGKKDKAKEILDFINKERDEGNMCSANYTNKNYKGFSASLCLSKLIKLLEHE